MGTSSMHYVRYSTESRGIMSVTPDLESHAVSHGTDRSTNPIKVSNDFIYQLFRVIKFTIIVISCHFGFHLFSNQKWHSNQCCVVNEKKCQFSFFFLHWVKDRESAGLGQHTWIRIIWFLHFSYEWHCYITVFQELLHRRITRLFTLLVVLQELLHCNIIRIVTS